MRDTQRAHLYRCDPALNALAKPLAKVADVERYVKKVFASKRVQAAFPKSTRWVLPGVGDGRGRRKAGGWHSGITIPLWARNEGVVLHELAHTICQREHWGRDVADHGWEFCTIYLRLALYMMGREAHDALKAAMKKNRVRFSQPRKRGPLDPEQRAALAARLAAYRKAKRPSEHDPRFANLDI